MSLSSFFTGAVNGFGVRGIFGGMDEAKIRLSPEELSLAVDDRVMLVKGAVIAKIVARLGGLSERQSECLAGVAHLLPEALGTPPKVSKGENYRGQPYVVLDNPRHFRSGDILALRTMFLWGHHLSVTLHLRGRHRERFRPCLEAALPMLRSGGFRVCVSDREWEHHFDDDNHRPALDLPSEAWAALLRDRPFTKVSFVLPPSDLNDGWDRLMAAYASLVALLR